MRAAYSFILALTSAQLAAQDRDLLPFATVKPDPAVAQRLRADWQRLSAGTSEWVYCVTKWSVARSQNDDTVYVITGIRSAPAATSPHETSGFTCQDERGTPLPLVHAHPSGDCSASRQDASNALAYEIPFGLIVCGPRSHAGYTREQYLLMMRGVWYRRANLSPN